MDVFWDVFALFVLFAITTVIVLTLLSIATGFASFGQDRSEPAGPGWWRGGQEESNTQAEADEAARQAARAAAQEAETG